MSGLTLPIRNRRALLAAAALLVGGRAVGAQQAHDHAPPAAAAARDTTTDPVAAGAEHAMSGAADARGHLMLTPQRAASRTDTVRARLILDSLRPVLKRYRDVRAAEADGYAMFAPQLKRQRVFHFTNNRHALRAALSFDAAKPTSLLYRKDKAGRFELVGAMYTAPARSSLDDLDARVPLGMARWHQHVNICLPPRAQRQRWAEMDGARMRFGPAGAITTHAACDAAGGRWYPQLFGWMVHVNALTPDPWSDEHKMH